MNSTGPLNTATTQKSKPSSRSSVRISFKSRINSSSPLSSTNSSASVTVRSLWICSGLKWQSRTKLILWLVSLTASFTMKSLILDLSIDLNSAQPSQDKSVWGRVLCFYNFSQRSRFFDQGPGSVLRFLQLIQSGFLRPVHKDFYRHKIQTRYLQIEEGRSLKRENNWAINLQNPGCLWLDRKSVV